MLSLNNASPAPVEALKYVPDSPEYRSNYFSAGPYRIKFYTADKSLILERNWPGHISAARVSNEIVHVTDLFTTLAGVAGARIPQDRPIDGVDQLPFFLGRQSASAREGF